MTSDSQPLALSTSAWTIEREFVLRSAGFPVSTVASLRADELAHIADCPEAGREEIARAYADWTVSAADALQPTVMHDSFREALAWQNRGIITRVLDRFAVGATMAPTDRRRNLRTLTSYLQRYATKNDQIGFYGPATWCSFDSGSIGVDQRPGPRLTAMRVTHFEFWAMDVMAATFAARPGIRRSLRPRLAGNCHVHGGVLYSSRGRTQVLDGPAADLLARCDGTARLAELGESDDPSFVALVGELESAGTIVVGFDGLWCSEPETRLRAELAAMPASPDVSAAVAEFDQIMTLRDLVVAARGDSVATTSALAALDDRFAALTAHEATRRDGESYAARSVVYDDAVRDTEVLVGTDVLDGIAEPLSMVLDSASWLVDQVSDAYSIILENLFEKFRARTDQDDMPLDRLVGAATPYLHFDRRHLAEPVQNARTELQRRWAGLLLDPADPARHRRVESRHLREQARRLFPPSVAPWARAHTHSPDLLLAGGPSTVAGPGMPIILGELHLAVDNRDTRSSVDLHPDPARLVDSAIRVSGAGRVVALPDQRSEQVSSRLYPPVLLSPAWSYWTMHPKPTHSPVPAVSAAALVVTRGVGEALTVTHRHDGRRWDLMQFLGDYLSGVVHNAFAMLPPAEHRPRIQIDDLIVSRETWTIELDDLRWPFDKTEVDRFRSARQWRSANGLPDQVFVRLPHELKPYHLDFRSPALVDMLAFAIRRGRNGADGGAIVVTEMLPDTQNCWLQDGQGHMYTSELRCVATSNPA